MAFNNRRSWRMKFINIDDSFQVKENDSPVIGYFAVRAPKGNVRPFYFGSDNGNAIEALIGPASADWPDIKEVIAFNKEYPVYVSAAPGSSAAYPSYIGGFYLTKNGIYKFYNISSVDELNDHTGNAYKVQIQPGRENLFNKKFADRLTEIEIGIPEGPETATAHTNEGAKKYGIKVIQSDVPYIKFTKDPELDVIEVDYDTMINGLVSGVGTDKTYWGDDEGMWEFTDTEAKLVNFGINLTEDENALEAWIGTKAFNAVCPNNTLNIDNLIELLANGYTEVSNNKVSIAFGIRKTFTFLVDIYEDVYELYMQKSPTEEKTTIDITKIGYDKYYYNQLLSYAPYDAEIYNATATKGQLRVKYSGTSNDDKDKIFNEVLDNKYVAFYDPSAPEDGIKFIGRREVATSYEGYYYSDVGAEDLTNKYIALQDAIDGDIKADLYHKFFKIFSEGRNMVIKRVYTLEEAQNIFGTDQGTLYYEKGISTNECVPVSPMFNQIELSCSEVIKTKTVSGGQWIGSLDPLGKNTYGEVNYWPQVLSDDDASFICVRVFKKFGDDTGDLDANGFWNHERIPTPSKVILEGDRYTTLVMEENKAVNKQGGEWNDKYAAGIRDSLVEATMPDYDDAWVFVECTGQEEFKSDLATISQAQTNAAVISPKILSPNNRGMITRQAAQKVVVNGRVNEASNAQYAGEFKVYDDVTKQYYWRKPIGSVGLMIAKIMDKRLGGVAPAWQNAAGLGGQLTDVVATEARYKFEDIGADDDATKTLDDIGINPIVFTAEEGVMITSQKTTQDPNHQSDWSYLGHSLSFQIVRRNIRDEVMRPQIMKPINSYWIGRRTEDVQGILALRDFWSKAEVDIAGQNNEYTKAQKNFVIRVDIWTEPWSEVVTLIMDNHGSNLKSNS